MSNIEEYFCPHCGGYIMEVILKSGKSYKRCIECGREYK